MLIEAEEDIKNVIVEAYIEGIHRSQNRLLTNNGFHEDFRMLVLNDNNVDKVDIDGWLKKVEQMKSQFPVLWNAETNYRFLFVDATGNSAVAKLEMYKGSTHFSTDYILLYKFEEGWKMVSKIFNVP